MGQGADSPEHIPVGEHHREVQAGAHEREVEEAPVVRDAIVLVTRNLVA